MPEESKKRGIPFVLSGSLGLRVNKTSRLERWKLNVERSLFPVLSERHFDIVEIDLARTKTVFYYQHHGFRPIRNLSFILDTLP